MSSTVAKCAPLRPIFRVKSNSERDPESRVVISTCRFYRGCAMQFGGNGATSGRESGFLHHDNAPSHTSLVVHQFLAERSIPVITQQPYSPDLAPSDFWLFPTLQIGLKGTRFATMEDIKSNTTAELRKVPKEAFRRCFQQWKDRWSKCVCARARVILWIWLGKRCHMSYHYSAIPHFRELFDCPLINVTQLGGQCLTL